MLLVSCLCFFVFVKGNLEQAAKKASFESIYVNTTIDYIVPGPSNTQVDELESSERNGIRSVTPYYETKIAIDINGRSVKNGTSLLFPSAEKMNYTPYGCARIINGATGVKGGDAVVDQAYLDKVRCRIGDIVSISIGAREYFFKITSVAETNTYYNNGTIALILTEDVAHQLQESGIKYSAAYISANDVSACETYLYSEYKPLSRLKDRSEFDSEAVYNQHLQNFNDADWSKEITNCQKNYKILSVRYENVQTGIWTNILIMAIIVGFVIVVFNTVLLTNRGMKSFMKAFLIKKSRTKDVVKAFYRFGITANAVVFCIASAAQYVFFATQMHISLLGLQILNCIIPILTDIIISAIMIGVSRWYVEKHYKVRVVKKKDSTEEVRVEVI